MHDPQNYMTFIKGNNIRNTGRTRFKKGEVAEASNSQWKGAKASYSAIHHWVRRKLGKACKCELCGTSEIRKYHWANISGQYRRDLSDYFQLCVPCHKKYDLGRRQYA